MNKAVIFDMDGTIINSINYHYKAWKKLLSKRGIKFSCEEFDKITGKSSKDFIKILRKKGLDGEIEDLVEEKDDLYLAQFKKKVPPLVDGFLQFLEDLKDFDFKTAIATSEPVDIMNIVVVVYGLLNKFDEFVSKYDIENSKPAPDIFLEAANKLNVPVQNCIVFEDSLSGVEAAKNAEMYCIALTTSYARKKLLKAGADKVIGDFTEINVGEILDALD